MLRVILEGLWILKLCGLLLKKSRVQLHRGLSPSVSPLVPKKLPWALCIPDVIIYNAFNVPPHALGFMFLTEILNVFCEAVANFQFACGCHLVINIFFCILSSLVRKESLKERLLP